LSDLNLALIVLVDPMEAFPMFKLKREKFSYLPSIILFALLVLARIASIYLVHYPLALLEPRNTNLVLEIVKMLIPILTWVVSCYAITSILNGETLFQEIFMAAAYSMLPYIILIVPISYFSKILTSLEARLYYTLISIVWLWVIILFFISIQSMNNYTAGETLGICLLSIIGVFLIWILFGLFYSLSKHLTEFIADIINEIKFIFS